MFRSRTWAVGLVVLSLATAVCRAAELQDENSLPWGGDPPAGPALARAARITELGRQLFFDTALSASGHMACATCHDPGNHFAPANALSAQRGGAHGELSGTRATPSLMYRAATPPFSEHYYESDEDGDESIDQGPTGGRTWDGRVDRARDQAAIPLLSANEMANASEQDVVAKASRAAYAGLFRELYGENIFADSRRAFAAIGEALEAFQETPAQFSPFSSKFDAVLRGQASLTTREARGLAAFNDPNRGNCAHCHKSQVTAGGKLPLFTDDGYVALGVPRNRQLPANASPGYFDLGACGPMRTDLGARPEYCGLFKAPSLRNVATRRAFYHNGVFHTLREAVSFYATRDTNPERWYPVDLYGNLDKFDDLPSPYKKNVSFEPPFGGSPGQAPALSNQDVDDIVAFLRTLTDGYSSSPSVRVSSLRHR